MKTFKIYLSITFLGLALTSCQKYVDIKKNSNASLIETANDCQLLLDNYGVMNTGYPHDMEVSADDYYVENSKLLSSDVKQPDRDFYAWVPTAIRPGADNWRNPYYVTYYSNLVLETVAKLQGSEDQNKLNGLRGAALFFRSFCFWNIAQMYAKPYDAATAGNDPGIPLRLSSDINDKSERGTVQQTYAQITKDLEEAATLMPNLSTPKSRPSKAAAYAMLARVYLSMGDYAKAGSNASLALGLYSTLIDYNTVNADSEPAFSTRFNDEVIFHAVMANNEILSPSTGTRIDDALYASYSGNDRRKVVFFNENSTGVQVKNPPNPLNPAEDTRFTDVSFPNGTFRFTGNYEPVTKAEFFTGLATDELYLIRAEARARANERDLAWQDLNTLLVKRTSGTYTPLGGGTANDALTRTLSERRKELLMRGLRWTDIRRLKLAVSRKTIDFTPTVTGLYSDGGNGSTYTITPGYTVRATYNLSADDIRKTLLIPDEVIRNSSIAQNPR